jgi:integrase
MHLFKRGTLPSSNYYAGFRVRGRYYSWSTATNKRDLALARAKDRRDAITANEYNLVDAQSRRQRKGVFGDVFDLLQLVKPDLKPNTRRNYRVTMACIMRPSHIELTDETPLTVLDRKLVDRYRATYCGKDPSDDQKRTFNSTYRQAKGLFSKPMRMALEQAGIKVPGLEGFLGAPLYRVQGTVPPRITKTVADKVEDALWKLEDIELQKALILMFYCGLRNIEVLHAQWSWLMQGADGRWYLQVGDAAYSTKGKRSRMVPVALEIASHLRRLMSHPIHIIGGKNEEDRINTCYRFAPQFCRMCGVDGHKPAYELRKWFGCMVASNYGLFATQTLMGHKDPQVTSDSYAGLVQMPAGFSRSVGVEIGLNPRPPLQDRIQDLALAEGEQDP